MLNSTGQVFHPEPSAGATGQVGQARFWQNIQLGKGLLS
jgi:hypothetical protein